MEKSVFSINLRKARKEKRWTQQEMAKRLFKARSTYARYEAGDAEPDHRTTLLICKLLEASFEEMTQKVANGLNNPS